MLQEPPASPYDLNFEFLGYPIRVFWGFWLMAVILGWGWANSLGAGAFPIAVVEQFVNAELLAPPILLVIWVAAVFLSILVHELGHSIAFKYYGTDSHIVLYHFGGVAVPAGFGSWNGARQRNVGPTERIVISAAGPVFQLLLAAAAFAIAAGLGIPMSFWGFTFEGTPQSSVATYAVLNAIIYPSVFWALLNLAPILPLDGGQIMSNALVVFNVQSPQRTAYMVSVFAGALLGIYFMGRGNTFAGIMFLMFAANNWQAMQYGGGAY